MVRMACPLQPVPLPNRPASLVASATNTHYPVNQHASSTIVVLSHQPMWEACNTTSKTSLARSPRKPEYLDLSLGVPTSSALVNRMTMSSRFDVISQVRPSLFNASPPTPKASLYLSAFLFAGSKIHPPRFRTLRTGLCYIHLRDILPSALPAFLPRNTPDQESSSYWTRAFNIAQQLQ